MRNRVRFPAEIVAAIRDACGEKFVISFRFSQWKESDFKARIARTPDELAIMLSALCEAGVSVLHASTRRFWEPEWEGSDLGLAGWARKLSGLPVITVGSVGLSADVMESFSGNEVESQVREGLEELSRRFCEGEFDLVSVGRGLIADPDWVTKVREKNYDSIRSFTRADLGLDGKASNGDRD
jgi:2,4-dienoyl-CoA reductase-like NADH-dependent reductase (Old Yellow Enzyme family)